MTSKNVSVLWVKPNDLHRHSPDCRGSGCVDVVARLDYERLRAALTTLLHNVETIGLNGVSVEHPHVRGVAMAREALSGKQLPDETREKWVAVSDQLPPNDGEEVLVFTYSKRVKAVCGAVVCAGWRAAQRDNEQSYYTHWQPMPDGPQSNGGEKQV